MEYTYTFCLAFGSISTDTGIMATQAVLIAETIAGMKKAISRNQYCPYICYSILKVSDADRSSFHSL